MVCRSSPGAAALIVFVACWMSVGSVVVRAQERDDVQALSQQAETLYQDAQYVEATEIAQRALAAAERQLRPDHPTVGKALDNLVKMYRAQGRLTEVEPLMRRALAIAEKASGPNHLAVASALNDLSAFYRTQGAMPRPSRCPDVRWRSGACPGS